MLFSNQRDAGMSSSYSESSGVVHRLPLLKTKAEDCTPEEAIRDLLRTIESGEVAPTSAIILTLQETGDDYIPHFYMCGPGCSSFSRVVGWLEYFKVKFVAAMGGIEPW